MKRDSKKIGFQRQNFSEQEILNIYQNYDGNRTKAANYWNIPRKTVSNWFLALESSEDFKKKQQDYEKKLFSAKPVSGLKINKNQKVYVVTSATNNTALHKNFLKALEAYCNYRSAQLIVIPIRYKNVTAYTSKLDYTPTWPKELNDYYLNHDLVLNDNLIVMGSFKAQTTAVNPLNARLGSMARGKSSIIGHPQISLKMVPTPSCDLPRQLITTGSVSQKNYSDTPTGDYGEFNHSFGATVVEILDNKRFNTRIINATNDGSFYEVDKISKSIAKFNIDGTVETGFRAKALATGDLHAYHLDPKVKAATWTNEDSIVNICRPEHEIIHDAFDHYAQNHHHKNDWMVKLAKVEQNRWLVEDELNHLIDLHNEIFTREDCQYHYIASNHNDALLRWLKDTDFRNDPHNARIYLKLSTLCIENEYQHPLYLWMRDKINNTNNTQFHTKNEKVEILGVDYGQHGDVGCNGAKGSPKAFVNAGLKTVQGHTHTPLIEKGVYVAGTSSMLQLEYNRGYSSWLQAHVMQYPNGKRTPITIIDGDW